MNFVRFLTVRWLFLFILVSIAGIPTLIFAETTLPGDTTAPFQTGLGSQVIQIELQGNQNVPTDQILEAVSTKIGEPVEDAKLKRDVHVIYDLGLFTDVKEETVKL